MRTRPLSLSLAFVLAFVPTVGSVASAQTDGVLDDTFSGDGWDFWNPSFATGVKVDDLAVRPDGQLAITGRVFAVGDREALSCVRNRDGGGGTCVNLPFDLGGGNNNDGNAVAVQSDNRMVIVGDAQGPVADPVWVATVERMSAANGLDGTFNGGTGAFQLGSTYDVGAQDVTVAANKIYLAGSVGVDMGVEIGSDFFVAVRKADGTPETAWSGDGWATIGFNLGGRGDDYAEVIAVDPLGRTVVAGTASDGSDIHFAVARFTVDGAYDGNWSGDGRQTVLVDLGGIGTLNFGGMAVDRFSRVVLAGVVPAATGSRLVVVRLTATGTLDPSFGGGDGVADFSYTATNDIESVVDVVTLTPPSDRIAILGDYDPAGADPTDGFVFALTTAGDFDATFNHTGKHAFAPASGDVWNHAQSLAVQAGRLVVLGGYHATTASVNLAWLSRLEVHLIFGDDFDAGHLALWSSVAP
jgi:uncharacterized delta-60 repeat protein